MKKRLLSLLLVLAMVFSLMPAALAADKPSFQSFFESVPANAETEPGSPNSTNKWKVASLDGGYVLKSGGAGKSRARSTLQLTFTADAELTFEYKVSSEPNYDYFTITYDGAEKVKESGDLGWKTYRLSAESGKVLTLTYAKDPSGDKFDDCVYVRNFTAGKATVVTFHANGGVGADYTQNFYGQAALKLNAFTKADGVFAGWATTPDGEVAYTDGTVKTRDYTLTVYSAAAAAAEARLAQAAQTLGETFEPAYGKDTNAADALAALLASKGYDDVTVTVKAAAGDAKASIDADGTIHYYFDAGMSSRSSYFYATFVLSLDGASVEKEVYVHITWDLARAQAVLQAELDRITLPTEPVTSLTLPRYPVKEGIDPSQVDYSKYDNFNTWATVTWTSANDQIVKVGSAPYTPYYAPYATTLTRTAADQQVTLTASIVCNSIEGLTLTKAFTVTVAASQESQATLREQLQAKLDAGFAAYGGLRDAVTGEPLEESDGKYIAANDIHFPTTRDFGVDGKYTPVIITSSDADTIVPPGVNNAARVEVYRPLPGEDAKDVTVTVTIKDKETGISVSRDFVIAVQPLTQQEIDDELALMAEVKAHYFDGIRNGNTDPDHITGNLHAFREAYLNADGQLVWVYDVDDQANHGIVPSELPGWQASERWRLFRSTNPAVISHENLLVTRATEHKAVTIVSELSSETLGKYAARYPDNADFQALSHQAVSTRLIVRGTAPTSDEPQITTSTVTFQLHTDTDMWIQPTVVYDQPEGTTAMDVFRQVLTANGYTYEAKGSYVQAITHPNGTRVAEFSKGQNSGWLFRVNGEFPDVAMSDYQLSDGDVIEVLFTANYMDEPGLFLPFTDVNNHWAYSAIKRVYNRGLMLGVSDTRFAPDQALSRAMLVTVLYRLADEPDVTADNPFTDVPAGQWYTNAVIWAAANGIVSGFGDGTFQPNAPATRAQAAVMLCGYAKLAGRDTTQHADLSAYADAAEIPSWALAEMQWANAAQLIRGRSDTILAPNAGTTRAEMAKILSTFIGK